MFIDDINNHYTYLNTLKNVVLEELNDHTSPALRDARQVIIHPELEPVLDKLMRERPTWRFKSTQRFYSTSGVCRASNFDIYDGDEKLGQLWTENHWRDDTLRFFFNNFRLEKSRQRSRVSYTTKPGEAVKRIVKAFHLKTPSERAVDAFNDVRSSVQKAVSDNNWPLRRAKSAIEKEMFAYAVKHWDEIKTHLTTDTKLDFPALVQADRESQEMSAAFDSGNGVTVRIEANSSYLVSRKSDAGYAVETYSDSTLPDHLRGSLGLLKLMDNGSYVADVGIRTSANLYFVMDKKDESNAA